MPVLAQEKLYNIDDIYNLKDGERAELIDGHIYYISPPNTNHQRILNFINTEINIKRWTIIQNLLCIKMQV